MSALRPNADAVRATYRWLAHADHGVSEVRVIRPGRGVVGIGFFDEESAFVEACLRGNVAANVYVGIQPRPRRFLVLAPNTVRPLKVGATNDDIAVLMATVIDIDPVRPKDTASTEAELAKALDAAREAAAWCISEGLGEPCLMRSGNGAQLWFALPPTSLTDDRRARLQAGLKTFEGAIRDRVTREGVHVDSIHDLARIIKVIGTVSHKGSGEGDRPHRVSGPWGGQERREDPVLLARLDAPQEAPLFATAGRSETTSSPGQAESPTTRVSLPVVREPEPIARAKARRTADGGYDFEAPVAMCTPVRRLWQEGHADRSLAIFNMVRFFVHQGLALEEITDLVLAYDQRLLGKLVRRNGAGYVRQAYEKVVATSREDGTVAPPCHALQKLTLCPVNRVPNARCDLEGGSGPADTRRPPEPRSSEGRQQASRIPFHGEVYEHTQGYACRTRHGEVLISSFVITGATRVVVDGEEAIIGDARSDGGSVVRGLRLPLEAFRSRGDLLRFLPSADLQWTGNDDHVQGLLRLLARSARGQLRA